MDPLNQVYTLKEGIEIIFQGVKYNSNNITSEVAIRYLAMNPNRVMLFEPYQIRDWFIDDLRAARLNYDDFILDNNSNNDNYIFIKGIVTRAPINLIVNFLNNQGISGVFNSKNNIQKTIDSTTNEFKELLIGDLAYELHDNDNRII
ncbi:hypothetical protein OX284_014605 [Flavobacterium sp. SUN046]|uniref:hypothetical protein n=1 Tax=Flavobacterium sp. SUN046 TaxID=3002440 RepID=UPI002DB7092A|nr:hypothetical protein [Flavobacterium sp. SUN046]MEC4050667.1 hypothetical protein [Flavobacterium sp. SUN046]